MSVADFSAVRPEAQRALGRAFIAARLKGLLDKGVTLWILVSGLTFLEPSPYEFMFALVFPLALFAGLKVYRSTGLLFILAMIFAPFGLIAAFQPVHTPVTTALIYPAITIFLMVSAAFVASYVAEAPQERVRRDHARLHDHRTVLGHDRYTGLSWAYSWGIRASHSQSARQSAVRRPQCLWAVSHRAGNVCHPAHLSWQEPGDPR